MTLENDMGTHEVAPFVIAQYPVTNAQFEVFVNGFGRGGSVVAIEEFMDELPIVLLRIPQ